MPFGISRQRLYFYSRDRSFLLKAGFGIVGAGFVLALALWMITGLRGGSYFETAILGATDEPEILLDYVRGAEFYVLADGSNEDHLWRFTGPFDYIEEDEPEPPTNAEIHAVVSKAIEESDLEPNLTELFQAFARGLYGSNEDEKNFGLDGVLQLRAQDPKAPFVNEIVGDLRQKRGEYEDAEREYLAELEVRESEHAVDQLFVIHERIGDEQKLRQLLNDSNFRKNASPYRILEAHIELKDIGGVFRSVLDITLASYKPALLGLGIFVAFVWFLIIGQFAGFRRDQIILYISAVVLGCFSAIATLFVVILQTDVYQTLQDNPYDLVHGLVWNIAGTGLREELIKLLFFIPLVPILIKRGSDTEALVVASMVGLGFALEENINYFIQGSAGVAVGRFLTATFMHIALTGLCGFAFYRMIRFPKNYWEQFLGTFILMIFAHGMYNAVQSVVGLVEYSFVSIIIIAVLAHHYFNKADSLWMTGSHQVSPLGIFVIGFALIIGISLNVMCFGMPPFFYALFAISNIGLVPVVFIFVNRFRNV